MSVLEAMTDIIPGTDGNYVGRCIKTLRLMRGWSQEDMANKMNISIPAFSKIETGITDVNLSRLEQIAHICEVSLVQLFLANHKQQDEIAWQLPVFENKIATREIEIVALQRKVIELYEELRGA
jgi:transcriptional regulator with XRE-family HTH domain